MFEIPTGIGQPLPEPTPTLPNGFVRMTITAAMPGLDDKDLLCIQVSLSVFGTTMMHEALFILGTPEDKEAMKPETWIEYGEGFKSFCEQAHVLIEGRKGPNLDAVLDAICEELAGRDVVAEVEAGAVKAWSPYVEKVPEKAAAPGRRRVAGK